MIEFFLKKEHIKKNYFKNISLGPNGTSFQIKIVHHEALVKFQNNEKEKEPRKIEA